MRPTMKPARKTVTDGEARKNPSEPIPSSLRGRLQRVTVKLGEHTVAEHFGINVFTLMRAISGLPVLRATGRVIAHAIDTIETS